MLILMQLILVSLSSYAGIDWVGNGGNVLQCEASGRTELLDYYEGRVMRGLTPDLGDETWSYERKVSYVLDRLAKVNPSRATRYRVWFQGFEQEAHWFENAKLNPVNDVGPIAIPADCEVKQVIVQRPQDQILPGDGRYIIDVSLWNQLSENDKAGLVLHEIIYREGIEAGQVVSNKVRYFNQMISSGQMESFDSRQMLSLVRAAGFASVDYFGVPVDTTTATYHAGGALHEAVALGGDFVGIDSSLSLEQRRIGFFENGALSFITLTASDRLRLKLGSDVVSIAPTNFSKLFFFASGKLRSVPVNESLWMNIHGQKVLVGNFYVYGTSKKYIEIHEDGSLARGHLLTPLYWENQEFRLHIVGNVELKPDGGFADPNVYAEGPSSAFMFGKWRSMSGFINLEEFGNAKRLRFVGVEQIRVAGEIVLVLESDRYLCSSDLLPVFEVIQFRVLRVSGARTDDSGPAAILLPVNRELPDFVLMETPYQDTALVLDPNRQQQLPLLSGLKCTFKQ